MEELTVYKDYVHIIEQELRSFLSKFNGPTNYYDYLRYHFGFKTMDSNGSAMRLLSKRFRPIMCLLIYKAIAGEFSNVIPLVLSAEMMHNASLIHDDIQDQDEMRWGRPTVWKIAGIEQGINCGDSLQAMAYRLILDLEKTGFDNKMIAKILAASNRIHLTVIEGQSMDLLFEKRIDISEAEYFEMISKKTATPYAGIAECAATLATQDKNPELVEAYRNFALKFGMLFQLTDDVLGIWGDVQKTGKISADIKNKKKTLPIIYAFHQASPKGREKLISLYTRWDKIMAEASEVLEILEETKAKDHCQMWIQTYYEETLQALRKTQIANAFQEKLEHMAQYCFNRSLVQLGTLP